MPETYYGANEDCETAYEYKPPDFTKCSEYLPKARTAGIDPVKEALLVCDKARRKQQEVCTQFAKQTKEYFAERGVCARIVCTSDSCGDGTSKTIETIKSGGTDPCVNCKKKSKSRNSMRRYRR
jgi:hypothetical protein